MILAIIQARMASTRLPGKVLADISGRPMLWHVVSRTRRAQNLDGVIIATTDKRADDPVEAFCRTERIEIFRGSEIDVLDRYYQAARQYGADVVVRITADCPLVDPTVVESVITCYQKGNADYVSNTIRFTYPDGLDVEVFSFETLEQTWMEASLEIEREHVTPYMRNSGKFKIQNVACERDLWQEGFRWTVDRKEDLEFVRRVYSELYSPGSIFLMADVLNLLRRKPELKQINSEIISNEGYYISMVKESGMLPPIPRKLDRSTEYLTRAKRVIPDQSQTFSKGPSQFVQGVSPVFLERGAGSHVWDVDGNEYIDYITALGPVILGYNWPAVTDAVTRQLQDGCTFSLPHPLEVEVAEMLVELIPCAEMVRFGKNGSDVTSAAVRVARAFTGREKIACCGYHGWQDWFIGTTTRNMGVPKATRELTLTFEYNNLKSLEDVFAQYSGQIAAVIMEPVGVVHPENDFLSKVKELTHKNGALLVFDEVITGFRVALGGAQEYFGVTPDLACFGKAMANGFPLSAIVGKREIMKLFEEVFFSFTFGGETLSLAAAKATITELREKNVISHLWEHGARLKQGYNVLVRELGLTEQTQCVGLPPRTVMTFSAQDGAEGLMLRSLLQQELIKRGVLFLTGHTICFSHNGADVDRTLRTHRAALQHLRDALADGNLPAFLDGKRVQPVFRKA